MPRPPRDDAPRCPTTAVSISTNDGSAARTTNAAAESRSRLRGPGLPGVPGRPGVPGGLGGSPRATIRVAAVAAGPGDLPVDLRDQVEHSAKVSRARLSVPAGFTCRVVTPAAR